MAGIQLGFKAGDERRLALPLAALFALLALWLGWGAASQWRAERTEAGLESFRDQVVSGTSQALAAQRKQIAQRSATDAVVKQLEAGNAEAAAQAMTEGWKEAQQAQVVPADLVAEYAGLPDTGFARLALLESALAQETAVAGTVRAGNANALGVAVPVADSRGAVRWVAYAVLPLSTLTAAIEGGGLPSGAYIALRHGNATLVERGDAALAGGADLMARPVKDTPLRVVAAVPERSGGPFGLGKLGCVAGALLFALLAALCVAVWRLGLERLLPQRGKKAEVNEEAEVGLTLKEAMQLQQGEPAADAAPVRPRVTEGAGAAVPPPQAPPVEAGDVDAGIFRAYDIRGVVGKTLDARTARLIGHAIGSVMAEQGLPEIVVGRDGRLSGPELVEALTEGLRAAGRNVIDIGMVPTPVCYFGAYHTRAGCAVAVTGSHNPPDYNGFKIVVGGETLAGAAITDLYNRISEGRLHSAEPGALRHADISMDYIDRIAGDVQLAQPLKVVVDAGNGVAGDIGPRLLEAIGAEVIPLYCEVDGNFPNHHPDPSEPRNLADLITSVQRFDADLGLAFDGDGDRLGVVTREGNIIFPDRLLMLFAADVVERNPGAQVIYDVKCTGKLQGWILRHGGTPLMWKTGHSLVKAKMRETDAALAGEMSGHFFFQERWYGFDDGLYSAARLLEILAVRDESPSEVLDGLPNAVTTPEIKVDVPDGNPHAVVERFIDGAEFPEARLSTIDGLRVDWPDGWGLLRASNTTPVLVLRFEADNEDAMQRIKGIFRDRLGRVAPELKPTF